MPSVDTPFRSHATDRWAGRHAVVAGDVALSYAELQDRVGALAAVLRRHGVGPEVPVACALGRTASVPVAMLAVWQAGGCYVPLDPHAPAARTRHILTDCRPAVLVTDTEAQVDPDGSVAVVVMLDRTGRVAGQSAPAPADVAPPRALDLAYMIYTSGSTGVPKGVLVEHASLAALAEQHERVLYRELEPPVRRVAVNNPFATDSSMSELVHLAFGRTLYVVDTPTRQNPDLLAGFITRHGIEVLDATPTQVRMLIMAGHVDVLRTLRVLIVGGEAVDQGLWTTLRGLHGVRVHNLYGPTECTVDVTHADVHARQAPTIGRPLPGCGIHLLDEAMEQVPEGAVGEICVSGPQVARGYLNVPDSVAARFTTFTPPGRGEPVRIYRTGDRARWAADGNLEYLGRVDDQVKVSGFRVELGEVEAALRRCPGVRDATVALDHTDLGGVLRAFVVLSSGSTPADVENALGEHLPAALVPVVTAVPRIPLGPSGKADRQALLAGELEVPATDLPDLPDPELVRAVWCELLQVAQVADGDDFFALGGDSIRATLMTLRVRQRLARDVPAATVFKHPTFGGYCAQVLAAR
ncbi:non-ribosomal peptide synthetase [Catellatospora citrea]|nr:non-ribosomal peptide synthetase [Catellatospora citrea]RKE05521.1 amino acid adenylation domain-containing protein [Catellatospora citrea]